MFKSLSEAFSATSLTYAGRTTLQRICWEGVMRSGMPVGCGLSSMKEELEQQRIELQYLLNCARNRSDSSLPAQLNLARGYERRIGQIESKLTRFQEINERLMTPIAQEIQANKKSRI